MCKRWEGVGITRGELEPGTAVMVPVGQLNAVVNGGPCLIALAVVVGPAAPSDTADTTVFTDRQDVYWLDVHLSPGVVLPQMYHANTILGIPTLGLSMPRRPSS